MAKCTITIDFNGAPEQLIASAEEAISGAGGSFAGSSSEGKFQIKSPLGKVSGSYSVVGQSFNILITDKPFLVSCSMIENELRKQIK